jgi:hypothetical protein
MEGCRGESCEGGRKRATASLTARGLAGDVCVCGGGGGFRERKVYKKDLEGKGSQQRLRVGHTFGLNGRRVCGCKLWHRPHSPWLCPSHGMRRCSRACVCVCVCVCVGCVCVGGGGI